MKSIIRNVLAVIVGVIAGSAINMGLVIAGSQIIPPPNGVDVTDVESIKAHLHLFEFRHFVAPFAAHAVGTLVGACVAVFIAVSHKLKLGMLIGVLFLIFGTINAFMLPSPTWFVVIDLIGAYVPMAWIGTRLTGKLQEPPSQA